MKKRFIVMVICRAGQPILGSASDERRFVLAILK